MHVIVFPPLPDKNNWGMLKKEQMFMHNFVEEKLILSKRNSI
jgi:hypothetical protein